MISDDINILGIFCGVRDVPELSRENIRKYYGIETADVMALFGGSIICGGDVLAKAILEQVAKKYVIIGGEGHTTQTLRDTVHSLYPEIETEGKPESYVFRKYIQNTYGVDVDYIETESTNCGNNITNMLELFDRENISCSSVILSQDATMQRRMAATLRKYRPDIRIINFATYKVSVQQSGEKFRYTDSIRGMWDTERYISLLLGEISRLTDNGNGYGPKGKGFIAHEDIPYEVSCAFERLKMVYNDLIREGNPLYA